MIEMINGNALNIPLADSSVQCVITSPPYWGLRDYGTARWEGGDLACDHRQPETRKNGSTLTGGQKTVGHAEEGYRVVCARCGAHRIDNQLGLELTPQEYVINIVAAMREVWRVLRDDGTLWLVLGDRYANDGKWGGETGGKQAYLPDNDRKRVGREKRRTGLKPKDLCGIPWRVAFALQADGWYLRSDIIWCLSGGTSVYVKTDDSGVCLMNVKDLARIKSGKASLWNGEKWTRMLGVSRSPRKGDEITFTLRSGERISCTPTHRFPTSRGLLAASDIQTGDVIDSVHLPEPEQPKDCAIDESAAWFAGLYLAEGSMAGDTIQLAGHSADSKRLELVDSVVAKYGGNWTVSVDGNKQSIRVYGKLLVAIIEELVSGRTAHNKGFSPSVWRYSNKFVAAMVQGYLDGDGHWDVANGRWRLGFCRNYNLERDLRTACARLGYCLTLNLSLVKYLGRNVPTFHGEIRMERSGHHNERQMGEVVEISRARCREVYDIGVADEPHLFALSSGTLTHNSKPNPMPESVIDRPTKSHEYVFLLAKSDRYYYDIDAIAEPVKESSIARINQATFDQQTGGEKDYGATGVNTNRSMRRTLENFAHRQRKNDGTNYGGNGSKIRGHVGDSLNRENGKRNRRTVWTVATTPYAGAHFATFPTALIEPMILAGSRSGDIVLDPFAGTATVGRVCAKHGRQFVGIELNPAYIQLALERVSDVQIALPDE